ncbi:MAG TPA: hypothetical protein VKZ43_02975 [Trueperaceae bacterium]|nr:hypothetical protein [Trueperaceae bacterium]
MLSRTEVERLAAMANALRPDWPIPSLATHIGAHYVGRAYRDVACALAYVATDAQTQTPARLKEQGPWWRVTEESRQPPVGRRIPCPDHPEQPAGRCQPCKDQRATPEQIAAARQRARQLAANPKEDQE